MAKANVEFLASRRAARLNTLPPYLFARIDALRDEVAQTGADVIDLGVGDPDLPTLAPVVRAMGQAIEKPAHHRYPAYAGSLEFRRSCAAYYKARTGISLDPKTEVLALIGSKEGIAHLPLAFVDPGDVVLVPDPGYPVYANGTRFCGGEPYFMPLTAKNGFLPDLRAIPKTILKRAKILWLNYPNNPTGARAPKAFFEEAVALCRKYDILLAQDAAYFEMYTDRKRPLSILEIDGAKEVSIEFHSHSKSYNMTGWRLGFAIGNATAIEALGRIKNNLDSGAFTAIQEAGMAANALPNKEREALRKIYAERRRVAVAGLAKAGFEVFDQASTFYVWTKVPKGVSSADFAMRALREAQVVITPGTGFGACGEGYFRMTVCADAARIKEAVARLAGLLG